MQWWCSQALWSWFAQMRKRSRGRKLGSCVVIPGMLFIVLSKSCFFAVFGGCSPSVLIRYHLCSHSWSLTVKDSGKPKQLFVTTDSLFTTGSSSAKFLVLEKFQISVAGVENLLIPKSTQTAYRVMQPREIVKSYFLKSRWPRAQVLVS